MTDNFPKKRHIIVLTTLFLTLFFGSSRLGSAENDQRNILKGDEERGIISDDLPNRKGIKIGGPIFHSGLKISNQFDSNIYLAHRGEHADTINIINPSIGFVLPMRDSRLSMEYDVAFNYFYHFPVNNHVDHRVNTLAEINLTNYKITLSDLYRRFKDRTGTEDVNRTKRQINAFTAGIETKELNRLFFGFNYTNNLQGYLSTDPILANLNYKDKSYMEHIFDIVANYRLYSKTYLTWDNDYGLIHYYKNNIPPDSYYIESLFGVRGELTNKIAANVKFGGRYQQYESSPLLSDKGYFNFIARGGLDYFATKDDTWSFNVERGTYESTYADMNYYELNSLGINYAHKFKRKLTGNIFGSIQANIYPEDSTQDGVTAKRIDKLYYGGCSLRYDLQKWVTLEAKYQFERRDSRFSAFTYTDNLVTVSGSVGF